MIKKLFLLLITCLISVPGAVKRVPSEYPKIQTAIDASLDGDTVLVSPGTYFENIIFRGKKIVVGSLFITTNDNSYIKSTVINGSTPVYSDTASCVLFINNEDNSSQLIGFTLTGGKGTRWTDEHGAGVFYEGGGVFSALSSPVIRNNIIINNEAIRKSSSASAGGGGLRCGDGSPIIINNIIVNNRGMYGGGIVLNYCAGAVVKNNIITQNNVYQAVASTSTYGGGGIWINSQLPGNSAENLIVNNTIVGNSSSGSTPAGWAGYGGGVYVTASKVNFSNNIVWNNIQAKGKQFNLASGSITVAYNDIQDGYTGTGNISVNPAFADSSFYLSDSSPLIDAGNPDALYNDRADSLQPGNAAFPSKGTVKNDIGAFGGPQTINLPSVVLGKALFLNSSISFGSIVQGSSKTGAIYFYNSGGTKLVIDSVSLKVNAKGDLSIPGVFPKEVSAGNRDSVNVAWMPQQVYSLSDTAVIYLRGYSTPMSILLSGNAIVTGINDKTEIHNYELKQNYPNPFNPSTVIKYSVAEGAVIRIKIFNMTGEEIITLVNEFKDPGDYEVTWNSKNSSGVLMPSGAYIYKIESGDFSNVRKMILMR